MVVAVPPAVARSRWLSALRELGLVAILFLIYKIGRIAATGHVGEAYDNADKIWNLERWMHLPGELSVQHRLLSWHWLVEVANCYYAYVHFPATVAVLVWLYIYRPAHYRWTRNVLALLTGTALVVHFGYPLAPPRMLTYTGMLDLGRLFGPAVYGAPETDQLSNQYAAMPSLHTGWALWCAIAVADVVRPRWAKVLAFCYPAATIIAILGTANHYLLDAVGGAITLGLGYLATRGVRLVIPRLGPVARVFSTD